MDCQREQHTKYAGNPPRVADQRVVAWGMTMGYTPETLKVPKKSSKSASGGMLPDTFQTVYQLGAWLGRFLLEFLRVAFFQNGVLRPTCL